MANPGSTTIQSGAKLARKGFASSSGPSHESDCDCSVTGCFGSALILISLLSDVPSGGGMKQLTIRLPRVSDMCSGASVNTLNEPIFFFRICKTYTAGLMRG